MDHRRQSGVFSSRLQTNLSESRRTLELHHSSQKSWRIGESVNTWNLGWDKSSRYWAEGVRSWIRHFRRSSSCVGHPLSSISDSENRPDTCSLCIGQGPYEICIRRLHLRSQIGRHTTGTPSHKTHQCTSIRQCHSRELRELSWACRTLLRLHPFCNSRHRHIQICNWCIFRCHTLIHFFHIGVLLAVLLQWGRKIFRFPHFCSFCTCHTLPLPKCKIHQQRWILHTRIGVLAQEAVNWLTDRSLIISFTLPNPIADQHVRNTGPISAHALISWAWLGLVLEHKLGRSRPRHSLTCGCLMLHTFEWGMQLVNTSEFVQLTSWFQVEILWPPCESG